MNNIYSKIDVSSGGSLMGTVDKEALVRVSSEYKLLNDSEYRQQWVEEQLEQSREYLINQLQRCIE